MPCGRCGLASDNTPALTCVSHISESVEPGYDALVAGHQRAVADLAGQIAGSLDAARQGRARVSAVLKRGRGVQLETNCNAASRKDAKTQRKIKKKRKT